MTLLLFTAELKSLLYKQLLLPTEMVVPHYRIEWNVSC